MRIESILNLDFLCRHFAVKYGLPVLTAISVLGALFCTFTVVPNERVMGAVQRIFYFHVGSAMASYLMIGLIFLGSVAFLVTREEPWDVLGRSSASVGFLLCSVVLLSGMIWGKSAWNVWWRWEPRLVSFLVLWLMLFSYLALRYFDLEANRNLSSILGIFIAANVPIVIFSVRMLDHREQLHPEVIANQGLRDVSFVYTLVLSVVAMMLLSLWLLSFKLTNEISKSKLQKLERKDSLREN